MNKEIVFSIILITIAVALLIYFFFFNRIDLLNSSSSTALSPFNFNSNNNIPNNDRTNCHQLFFKTTNENPFKIQIDTRHVISFELKQALIPRGTYFFPNNATFNVEVGSEHSKDTFSFITAQGNYNLTAIINLLNANMINNGASFIIFASSPLTTKVTITSTTPFRITIDPTDTNAIFARKLGFTENVIGDLVALVVDAPNRPRIIGTNIIRLVSDNTSFTHSENTLAIVPIDRDLNVFTPNDFVRRYFKPETVHTVEISLLDEDNSLYQLNGLPFSVVIEVTISRVKNMQSIFS